VATRSCAIIRYWRRVNLDISGMRFAGFPLLQNPNLGGPYMALIGGAMGAVVRPNSLREDEFLAETVGKRTHE
jgi:hypothetical protein